MSESSPRMPMFSVFATVVLILVSGAGILACGSSSKTSAGGRATCQVGSPIERVEAPDLPACAAYEDADTAYSYSCSSNDVTDFFVIFRASTQLYGKPGGHWRQAAADVPFDTLRRALLC